ncbi:FAD-dependent oxidoreductase [Oceanibaculum pacificum]|uniref:Ribosomal subunit interface protein n=1 Tax=Oceanibaculum pacificum TaxID=580166 RepID=A0A154W3D8_9PROT|nr:FAD-dependent oxidoreductase [Oceanibaculum pacificum]KZD07977.1 ribosomal subunit interface protein [Oceanibaculum pacificum]
MGWLRAASFSDLKEGGVVGVDVAGTPVALYLLDGALYATHNICTHQFAFLSDGYVEDGCVECPLHQGQFDIRTGEAKCAPVTGRLATYAVKRAGDDVFVDLETTATVEAAAPAMPVGQDSRTFVIVGGGQAGCRAAQHLRGEGFAGRIVMIAEEAHPPYERPPLSKDLLLGKISSADCHVLKAPELAALDVDLRTGTRAGAIDRKARQVALSTGERLGYDKLLIATGARARYLPDVDGVLYLRTMEDAQAIGQALATAQRLAIIGGGFIGLELASVARARGVEVVVIEREPVLMSRILPPAIGQAFQALAESTGVAFRLGAALAGIRRNGVGTQLVFADGSEMVADLVVAGIGAIANTELAETAGLSVAGGIVIDEACRTSDANIFAAGDCALYPQAVAGRRIRLESWANAEAQGRAAALAMLGKPAEAPDLPWFWTEQFGLNIQMVGIPHAGDRVAVQGEIGAPESVYLTERDGHIASAIIFGDAETFRIARRRFQKGEDPSAGLKGLRWLDQQKESSMGYERTLESLPQQAAPAATPAAKQYVWPADGLTRVPDWVYTDDHIYGLEVEKIFKGHTWNYVGLEAEIPKAGDFIRSYVGPIPVVVSRDEQGGINVFENRCSHRAAEFCRELRGNATEFVCPYHQWTYDLKGNLAGIPFRRGVDGKGGMPKDFNQADHHPRKLAVTTRGGVIFASYADDMEPFDAYLGPEMTREFDATFDGRKLVVLGYYRNTLPGNWKLYHENLKDPYHATLLHTFLVTFGLLVAGNKSLMLCDESGRHGAMCSAKSEKTVVSDDSKKEMRAYKEGMVLEEPRFMDFKPEFDSPWSVTMSTIWPNLIVQREMNTLGVRHIVPEGPNQFTMIWTMFGFEGDDEEMTRHRLRQGNLMGPAGFLGLEDNEAIKFVQDGMKNVPNGQHLVALDPGTPAGTADTLISESAIRAMYKHWRDVIGV